MGEPYFTLKQKLEDLGYNNTLPVDAAPLVECILADLLQTARSLQHYMEVSKDALKQRDSLVMEAEPYRCENNKLIQENNRLHKEITDVKEEYERLSREYKRKAKSLTEELKKKDSLITKLQHDIRDLNLRGLCAETLSSRNKSKRKDSGDALSKPCTCNEKKTFNNDRDVLGLTEKINGLQQLNQEQTDEIIILKKQIEHRENEILRLKTMLERSHPINSITKNYCNVGSSDSKILELQRQVKELENVNELLKKEIENGLDKQHEAMLRALNLADKNKNLQDELKKVDAVALKLEEDCNQRLNAMIKDIKVLQYRIEELLIKNSELENELIKERNHSTKAVKYQESMEVTRKEKEALEREIKDLVELNQCLQEKVTAYSQKNSSQSQTYCEGIKDHSTYPTKEELQKLLENERKKYEEHIKGIQTKLNDTLCRFNMHLSKCKDKGITGTDKKNSSLENTYVRHLNNKLCDSEQKILRLKKDNNDLRSKIESITEGNKRNYKDIINQLNIENTELSSENIAMSKQLNQFKNLGLVSEKKCHFESEIRKLKEEIINLKHEVQILKKDKQEYNLKYKEALEMTEKLKRELVFKQKDIEKLEEENCSYKMTHRNGKASEDQLKDECNFLREQIKLMQSDVIKEKTLANQIKNIQLETERCNNEVHNECISIKKQLNLSKSTIDDLERKCKELQSEIVSLKNDKSVLIENLKKMDQQRDKLIIELDHKTETICSLEHKLKSQSYDATKLENELCETKRKLNVHKVAEHKIIDGEAQISFLNGELLRLQQKLDGAIMENKHLQNSLADANGALKIAKIEYDKSRKEVDSLKQQLQHYVAEIRRIEEMLSQKEAERSDMLEHFASLSVEANILENTNHSLENESASKSLQLQTYVSKIESLESKLIDKESIIDNQSARIASLTCKMTSLENEIKLITEEKTILEQNISYLKQMCSNKQCKPTKVDPSLRETDSELKLYENNIKSLLTSKAKLEVQKDELREQLTMTEELLSNARREIVDLKLTLQDATSETKSLQERLGYSRREDSVIHEGALRTELEIPLMLEDATIEESQDDGCSGRYRKVNTKYLKYSGSTM